MNRSALSLLLLTTSSVALAAEDSTSLQQSQQILPPEVTITKGNTVYTPALPGSGQALSKEAIEQANTTDISNIVRKLPGVNVQEEDGFGLRPNIGLRGGRVDRSSDITLMEDGVLIAPAPYAAPSAYYFPHIERMDGIEVLKGSSSIKYGPRTTNGAINLLSSRIPYQFSGDVSASIGSYGGWRTGTTIGDSPTTNWGYVIDAHTTHSDGFKDIDRVGGDTGFIVQDYMGKLRYKTDAAARFYQEIEFKAGYTDELSDETYLGLTQADFLQDPYRRYASSQRDRMKSQHKQFQLGYTIEPMRGLSVTTTAYTTGFNRNWNKLQSVDAGNGSESLADVLDDPAAFADEFAILTGSVDSADDALTLRQNKREYTTYGLQTRAQYYTATGPIRHAIEVGARVHYDEEDRFQQEDDYRIVQGIMQLTTVGELGSQANRIGKANAVSGYVLDSMQWDKWTVTPGLRYEYIDLEQENFGSSDPGRTGVSKQENGSVITAFIPGIGIEYQLTDSLELLAGVHKGFAPPAPPGSTTAENIEEETSVNYEAGVRYRDGAAIIDLIGYYTAYDNLLGEDTFSAGGFGTGEQFNGGEVDVYGVEALARYDVGQLFKPQAKPRYRFPLMASYTFTHATFQNSFNSDFSEWGNVQDGDELPYIPEHQGYVSAGVETDDWNLHLGARYTDRMRTVAGQGDFVDSESTDSNIVFDAGGEYHLGYGVRAFVTANNLFDEEYVAARRPAGARPGAPQIVFAGLKWQF